MGRKTQGPNGVCELEVLEMRLFTKTSLALVALLISFAAAPAAKADPITSAAAASRSLTWATTEREFPDWIRWSAPQLRTPTTSTEAAVLLRC